MPKSTDFVKTWLPGPSRGTTNFTAPGNFTIPYGRFVGVVSGRGGSGNAPNANYITNYNVAFPIATQPIATQPIATWNTNYNTVYPIANQPVANKPVVGFNPPFKGDAVYNAQNYSHSAWNCPPLYGSPHHPSLTPTPGVAHTAYNNHAAHFCPFVTKNNGSYQGGFSISVFYPPSGTYCTVPVGFYGVHNHSCNIPVPGNPNYTTNYNTNYNTVYPIANRPAATWNTNYNTNYNTIYPIATQPIANYNPGNKGAAASVLGVTLPGGPIDLGGFAGPPGLATPISPTVISYYDYPDDATYPVDAPTGTSLSIELK